MSAGAVKAGGVFVEIGADPTKFFAALNSVNKNIASMGKTMTSAGTKMAAMGAGIVGPIFASAAAFANVGSALFDMSKRTGVATESLSVLQFAAEQTGTDMGGVETALKKMQKAIFAAGTGSEEAAKALAMVGLSAADLAGLSADQQMGKIADGLMAIQDPGTRAAVAMQIFGKSGTAILPMLEGGSAGMAAFADEAKRLGLVMDSETAAKADALGDAIDAVKSSMKMAFIQVGSAVAPILTQLAQGLAIVAANVGKFISENQAFVVSVLKGGAALVVVGSGVALLGRSITLASTSFSVLGAAASLAVSPLTMLIGGASGVAKSFTMAMPATLTLANSIGSSMLGASASVLSFASAAVTGLARFVASVVMAGVASVANAVLSGAAWVASALPGVLTFVGGAVAGIASYIGAAAMAVAASVASAAAVAAAWLAPLAPLLLLSAAAVGIGVAVKQFGPQIAGAFSGLAGYASDAAGAIGSGLNTAVSDGIVVLGDLATTATTTFDGIYEAISAGDLSGAMAIAMTGLQAAFFDVAGPFLTQVSEWATKFQGIFDDIGVGIAVAMESADGFFKKNVADLGNPQAWGAAPAIGGVPASSKEELAKRAEGIQSQTDRNVAAMEADAKDRSGKRIAAASDYALSLAAKKTAAKSNLTLLVSGKSETRAKNSQVDDLLSSIKGATSVDQLAGVGGLGDQFSTLRDLGRLTSNQEMMLSNALDKAAEGLTATATDGAKGAGDQSVTSKAEVAGTFSSTNLGGMGFGSSLAERQLKTLESIDKNTKNAPGEGMVAA